MTSFTTGVTSLIESISELLPVVENVVRSCYVVFGRVKSDLYNYYKSALTYTTRKILKHGSLVTRPIICLVQICVVINSNVCPSA